jgi:hypothetical protein
MCAGMWVVGTAGGAEWRGALLRGWGHDGWDSCAVLASINGEVGAIHGNQACTGYSLGQHDKGGITDIHFRILLQELGDTGCIFGERRDGNDDTCGHHSDYCENCGPTMAQ